ncbi:integrase catalytic domain-containing protein [Trichonephila clavipes]|nr:integrase catalytic domain-containing protein [Trichonephila clavipes]
MYRQILVDPNQRDLQRIMWKTSADAPVKTYKLATPRTVKDLSESSYVFDKELQDAPVKTLGMLWGSKGGLSHIQIPLSDNINEYEVLTPGHFIIGRPISAIPEPAILDISDNRLSRWQYTTKCVQTLWKRWKNDYLNHLQQRNKWQFEKNNVAIGCLVLLRKMICLLQMGNGKNLGGYLWK